MVANRRKVLSNSGAFIVDTVKMPPHSELRPLDFFYAVAGNQVVRTRDGDTWEFWTGRKWSDGKKDNRTFAIKPKCFVDNWKRVIDGVKKHMQVKELYQKIRMN